MKKLFLILLSTSLVSCLSVSLTIDEDAAKSIADAINKSNQKELHIMKSSNDDIDMLSENQNIMSDIKFGTDGWRAIIADADRVGHRHTIEATP